MSKKNSLVHEIVSDTPDAQLIEAIKHSDHVAFEVFFRRHFEAVYQSIWQLIRNDEVANDLAQETFVKAWEKRQALDPEKSSKAFLQAIARNQALSWLRMPRNRHHSLEGYDFPEEESLEENDEVQRKLHWVIKDLPEPLRVVVNLRLRGFKDKEIADLLTVSVATVDKRKTKAFAFIREHLQPYLCYMLCLKNFF